MNEQVDQQQNERDLIEDTSTQDPGSEGEVSQDPNWVPEHVDGVAGPVAVPLEEVQS